MPNSIAMLHYDLICSSTGVIYYCLFLCLHFFPNRGFSISHPPNRYVQRVMLCLPNFPTVRYNISYSPTSCTSMVISYSVLRKCSHGHFELHLAARYTLDDMEVGKYQEVTGKRSRWLSISGTFPSIAEVFFVFVHSWDSDAVH